MVYRSPLQLLARTALYAILAVWTFVCLFPLYWVAVNSIKSGDDIMEGPRYLPFIDFTPSPGAWSFILSNANENLILRYVNSGIVAMASTLLCLCLGAMAVYGFTRFRAPVMSAGSFFIAMLASRILPPAVLVLPIYMMALYTNTLDTRFALVVTYTAINLPVAIWLLRPVLGQRASEQEEAAFLDGASQLRIFFEVTVPMAAAGMAAAGLLIFVLCWNEYLFAAYLAADNAMTVPPWMVGQLSLKEAQVGGDAEEWANLSAATVLMAAPLLVFTGLVQRVLSRVTQWRR